VPHVLGEVREAADRVGGGAGRLQPVVRVHLAARRERALALDSLDQRVDLGAELPVRLVEQRVRGLERALLVPERLELGHRDPLPGGLLPGLAEIGQQLQSVRLPQLLLPLQLLEALRRLGTRPPPERLAELLALQLQLPHPLEHLVRRLAAESSVGLLALGEQLRESVSLCSRRLQSLDERAELSILELDLSRRPMGDLLVEGLPVLVEQLAVKIEIARQLSEPRGLCREHLACLVQLFPLRGELRLGGRSRCLGGLGVLGALSLHVRGEPVTLLLQLLFEGRALLIHLLSVARELGAERLTLGLELRQGLSVAPAEACVGIQLTLDDLLMSPEQGCLIRLELLLPLRDPSVSCRELSLQCL